MNIAVLSDNTASSSFAAEHGLSLLLELDSGNKWLWDTGQSGLFLQNAQKMGIDLKGLSGLALSHGHYDHTGGIADLVEDGFSGPVYGHPGVTAKRYKCIPGSHPRDIAIRDRDLDALRSLLIPVQSRKILDQGLTMITDIPRHPDSFQAVDHFSWDSQGKKPDHVPDDSALLVDTRKGPVLVLGCCHSGLKNTLYAVQERCGMDRISCVVGGLHLINADNAALHETLEVLEAFGVVELYAGHCTGMEALNRLNNHSSHKTYHLQAGNKIRI